VLAFSFVADDGWSKFELMVPLGLPFDKLRSTSSRQAGRSLRRFDELTAGGLRVAPSTWLRAGGLSQGFCDGRC